METNNQINKADLVQPWMKSFIEAGKLRVVRKIDYFKLDSQYSWSELAMTLNDSEERLRFLNPNLTNFDTLRKGTKVRYLAMPLEVSYTDAGLVWACKLNGISELYKEDDAVEVLRANLKNNRYPLDQGLTLKNDLYITTYVPKEHVIAPKTRNEFVNRRNQFAEYVFINKAYRMLYGVGDIVDNRKDELVHVS